MGNLLQSLRIGARLILANAIALLLMLAIGAAGYWGLIQAKNEALHILAIDAALVEVGHDSVANTLSLRRFEKDIFLNITSK